MKEPELRRDLTFVPIVNKQPSRLSLAQIERYNREGFIQPYDVFSGSEISRIRHYFDRLMANMGDQGAYGINCYQARMADIWDIANQPRILDIVEDIVGRDIICWASAILSKKPHDPRRVPWHQDASFWHLSPARTVTVWLAIDDADEANAAMRFIPRSHDRGALKTSGTDDQAVFREWISEPVEISAILMATKSHPRSLLSIPRLTRARSRFRSESCSLTRMAQISFRFKGGFWPISHPLFQAPFALVEVLD